MTLILMGDWCSEVIADTLSFEISARVKTLETRGQFQHVLPPEENCPFLHTETFFS
jgi:hypothetical protein